MAGSFQAAIGRIQDIEAKLGIFHNTPAPTDTPRPTATGPDAIAGLPPAAPFPVMLAKANGQVTLLPIDAQGPRFTPQIESLILKYAAANKLDSDVVRAVVQQESSGNPREVSPAGAQGLMQLMPETGRMYGVTDPFDPEQNISAGTRHLANLMREFKNDLPTALAAYNAGSGAVRKAGGIPNYPETQDYVRKITDMVERTRAARDGF